MRRAACAALLLAVACEKAHPDPPPPRLAIRYAARTDAAPDGTNNTYFSIVEDDALFVVADADNPRDGKLAADRLSAAFKDCRGDDRLGCAVGQASVALRREHASASLGAVAIADDFPPLPLKSVQMTSAGHVRVVYRHRDYFETVGGVEPPLGGGISMTLGNPLAPGDSLLLVNQRLLDVVGEARVRAAMPDAPTSKDALEAAVARLLDDAKTSRRPDDPSTAILVQVVTTEPLPSTRP